METRYFSKSRSNLKVTPLIFGAWSVGGPPFWNEKDEAESVDAITAAIDARINCIDTAPVYGFGRSEEIVGKAIKGKREKVIIATKVGLRWSAPQLKAMRHDLSAESIKYEIDASLKRLDTDYIDLIQVHWPDPDTDIAESMNALMDAKNSGLVKEIGVSNYSTEQITEALKVAPIVSLQPEYNMLTRDIEAEKLPFCRENNVGVIAYSPLASGVLTGRYDTNSAFTDWRGKKNFGVFRQGVWEEAMVKVGRLKSLADEIGVSLSHLAIRWVTKQEGVTAAIVGANNADQAIDNVAAFSIDIGDDVWDKVAAIIK